jgi:hypothetical protein
MKAKCFTGQRNVGQALAADSFFELSPYTPMEKGRSAAVMLGHFSNLAYSAGMNIIPLQVERGTFFERSARAQGRGS